MELKLMVLAGLCLFALTLGAAIDETSEPRSRGVQDSNPLFTLVAQLFGKVEDDVDDLDSRLDQLQTSLNKKVDSPLRINCHWKTTAWNADGGGNAYFLDRHEVDCGTDFLVYLHLKRSSDLHHIQYKYKCCSVN